MTARHYFKRILIGTTALVGLALGLPAQSATITISSATSTTQNLNAADSLIVTGTGKIATPSHAVDVAGASATSISNSGTISGSFLGIGVKNSGDIISGITNSNIIAGHVMGIAVTSNGDISGGITNSGTISAVNNWGIFVSGSSHISGTINNTGLISGPTGIGVQVSSDLAGGIVNSDKIEGVIAISVWEKADISGGIQNSGLISGTATAAIFVHDTSDISGGITNNGVIKGDQGVYLLNKSNLGGGILNDGTISALGSGILVNGSNISGGITNNGVIAGGFSGIAIETGKITGGIINNPTGTIESTGGHPAILFDALANFLPALTGITPIDIEGGRIIGDVTDMDPSTGFSRVKIGGDFTTEGDFDVSSMEISQAHTLTVGSGYTIKEKTLTFDVDNTSSYGKLVMASGAINLTGVTVTVSAGAGVSLSVGDEIKIGDGTVAITGGPGGTKTAVVDNTSLFDFQIADGTAATTPTDASDLFLFVVTEGTNPPTPTPAPTPTPTPDDNFLPAYDVLIGLDGSAGAVLQNAIDAIKAASSAAEVDSIVSSVTPTTDGAVWNAVQGAADKVVDVLTGHFDSIGETGNGVEGHSSGMAAGNMPAGVGEWGEVFGQAADEGERGGIAGYSANTFGFAMGMETPHLAEATLAGVAISYARTNADSRNSNTTSTDVDSYQLTLYANRDLARDAYLRGMIGYAYDSNTTDRHNVGGAGGPTAHGEFGANQYMAHAEIGRHYFNGNTILTPSLLADWLHYDPKGYTETGAGLGSLTVSPGSMDIFAVGGGIKIGWGWKNAQGERFLPEMHAGYRYDLVGDKVETTSVFGAGGGAFSTQGPAPARNRFNFGAGFTYQTSAAWDIRANYDYDVRQDYHAHSGLLRTTYRF